MGLGSAEENENLATFENTAARGSLQTANLFSALNDEMIIADLKNGRGQDPLELTVKH